MSDYLGYIGLAILTVSAISFCYLLVNYERLICNAVENGIREGIEQGLSEVLNKYNF